MCVGYVRECAGILVIRENAGDAFQILAGSGCYRELSRDLSPDLKDAIQNAFLKRKTEFLKTRSVLYLNSASGTEVVVLLEATLLLLALLPAPLLLALLALQVLLAPQALLALLQVERPQAERAERPLLPLPVLVRVTPQLQ